ncbi:MAG: aspartate aminotransferase family protein [Alphaproteobacteria bacterium]|nr:aspartate aminotransferase family protein [Alphaproteobacteria bacterium SS10]
MNKQVDPKTLPTAPNDLEAYWMPFTPNRQFKADPRMIVGADGMYYTGQDGRQLLDGAAGLWCVNAGHNRKPIADAVNAQLAELDYVPAFQMGHPKAFEMASRLTTILPQGLDHVFFSNSGSEAVDTALKIAIGYHRARGEGQRTRLIGRERGYHGVGFGGISVGGMPYNRKTFNGALLPHVDHLPHTHHKEHQAFSKGQPEWGAHLADQLEDIVALHDASTIAAVIVEPIAGSTGVLVPPKGYLERLREICDKHGLLLIFDEVICGFGRLGTATAAEYFGITPDIMTMAKGITNGVVPMGATAVSADIYNAFMQGPDHMIEFFHGYTYSGHPLAAAAGLATLDIYRDEGLFDHAAKMAPKFEEALHSLKNEPNVIDIRNMGMIGAVELEPVAGTPTKRAYDVFLDCWHNDVVVRFTGDTIAMSPPLIMEEQHIEQLVETLRQAIRRAA